MTEPPDIVHTIPKEILAIADRFESATGYYPPNAYLWDVDPALPEELDRYRLEKAYARDESELRSMLM